jgi:hypothetical protein
MHHSLGAGALGLLYEKNMTNLPQNRQFGIAAVTASGASSGIKWATCSVPYDDSPPAPRAPSADCLWVFTIPCYLNAITVPCFIIHVITIPCYIIHVITISWDTYAIARNYTS